MDSLFQHITFVQQC